ncbi:MAG: S9 family peptidase [Xanthomonadales bacterium]|nr:S9 family peptidase [Xanthomonadales bacterium]
MTKNQLLLLALMITCTIGIVHANTLVNSDIFGLEYASDPQISPDGEQIVYVRKSMDIMKDRGRSNLWIIDSDGNNHRAIASSSTDYFSPRWSADGNRLAYASSEEGSVQIYLRWMDSGQVARLTDLTSTPSALSWSPDGRQIAFTMPVAAKAAKPFGELPEKPEGAEWAPEVRVINSLNYRADGHKGFLPTEYVQVFVIPSDGGTPRQLTSGNYNHDSQLSWSIDSSTLFLSANLNEDWEYEPLESDLYSLTLADGTMTRLTQRVGPDFSPEVSPDGRKIAYLGFDDHQVLYENTGVYVMDINGANSQLISGGLDRGVNAIEWTADSKGLVIQYDDGGESQIAHISLTGDIRPLAGNTGGTSLGRPYAGGSFSIANNGAIAFNQASSQRPAELAVMNKRGNSRLLTQLNEDLLAHKTLGKVEELHVASSFDGRDVEGWILYPPNYESGKKWPLILEIHGGPVANYGPRFTAEGQLYAAAGYVVVFMNPRGSDSYGKEFVNLIHHNYPSQDYDDLMTAVDTMIERGIADPEQLYVTGGSGGGVLTAWIVGKTDRFRAAVVAKPVINWTSFNLTADAPQYFSRYWFGAFPWEDQEQYWRRSPLSLVGNVTTPTMLLTGESDYRTPIGETEQFYLALKLQKVDTAMVRVPEASHGIAGRPSNLIAKVVNILGWFELHKE